MLNNRTKVGAVYVAIEGLHVLQKLIRPIITLLIDDTVPIVNIVAECL